MYVCMYIYIYIYIYIYTYKEIEASEAQGSRLQSAGSPGPGMRILTAIMLIDITSRHDEYNKYH